MKFPNITTILGYCGTGKSHLVKYIIKENLDKIDYVIVITSTKHNNQYTYLGEHGMPNKILGPLDLDKKIAMIMNKMKKNFDKYHVMIVFDDVMGSIKEYSNKMNALLSTFRHYNLSIIFVSQYAAKVPTYIRELTYYCFTFDQKSKKSLENVYDSYFQEIDTFKDFKRFFKNKLKEEFSFYFVDRVNNKKFVAKAPANL